MVIHSPEPRSSPIAALSSSTLENVRCVVLVIVSVVYRGPMSTPRVAPGSFGDLGPINWVFARGAARVIGVDEARIFSTLGRAKGLFRGWLHFGARLMPFGALSRKDSEMIIIRVAHLRRCDYELDHHRRLGARAGISSDEFDRILAGPDEG